MDKNTMAMVLLWIMCVGLLLIVVMIEMQISELKRKLKEITTDCRSNTSRLGNVIKAVVHLETRMNDIEEEPRHESNDVV